MSRVLLLSLSLSLGNASIFQIDEMASSRAEEGRRQLEELLHDSSAHKSCWEKAVETLSAGCRQMNDTERSHLAVQFANCHLAKSGLPTYACSASMDVAACTLPMVESPSGLAFSTYTLFYSHAESMCFYLQSSAFQQATESSVLQLQLGTQQAASQLRRLEAQAIEVVGATSTILHEQQQAAELAAQMQRSQKMAAVELASLQASQASAFARSETLVATLSHQSSEALDGLRRETDALTSKQRTLLGGLDQLLSAQSVIFGEFMDLKTIVFYTCAVLLGLALTSTPRTAAARLLIFAIL